MHSLMCSVLSLFEQFSCADSSSTFVRVNFCFRACVYVSLMRLDPQHVRATLYSVIVTSLNDEKSTLDLVHLDVFSLEA